MNHHDRYNQLPSMNLQVCSDRASVSVGLRLILGPPTFLQLTN